MGVKVTSQKLKVNTKINDIRAFIVVWYQCVLELTTENCELET